MTTKREYLVSLGLAKPGRGKFSNDAKAVLAKAIADGKVFSDAEPKVSVPRANKGADNSPKPTGETLYICPSDFRFPEGEYVAKAAGKSYSMRECCNTCRVSLTNHGCDNPTIHNNISVKIVRR